MPVDQGQAVLDTNVVSILRRGDSPERDFYGTWLQGRHLLISFMTEYEIRLGIESSGWSSRRKQRVLDDLEYYEVVDGDSEIVLAAVELMVRCKHQRPSLQDLFIASTAYALHCPLVTDDRRLVEQLSAAGFEDVITRHAVGLGG